MSQDRNHVLSIDIGGASCRMGRVSASSKVQDVKRVDTSKLREEGPEFLIEQLRPYVEEYAIDGIAMAIPATVDWDHNHVRSDCEEVEWLADSSNKKKIQDALKRPLLLVNDVEALLVGEWLRGELKGMSSGVVISLGESMGSAMLWGSQPQQGRRGSIMELEHVSLNTHGEDDGETPPGSAHHWLSGQGLRKQLDQKGELVNMEEFFQSDDDAHREIRNEFVNKLSHLLGTVVMMLDPERIVLGGGLTRSHKQWYPEVKETMDDYIMEQFSGLPSVTFGQLRENDVLIGPAAFWDWKQEE
ncbi:MAG: ROK family protein [bacterium]